MMEKKGQAAMEFLMTYGWAILAAVIAIGVLIYFGVFSPSRFVPETCILSAPLGCNDDSTASVAGIDLILENGGGEDYNVEEVEVTNCGTYTPAIPDLLKTGDSLAIPTTIVCDPVLTAGEQFRSNIIVTYKKLGGNRALTSTGSIARTVIA